MLWPMQALCRFVTGPDVISSIVGWRFRKSPDPGEQTVIARRMLVLAGAKDVLCTPSILKDAAERYNAAFQHCVRVGRVDGISEGDFVTEGGNDDGWDGVSFRIVKGLGHHLQNHVEWKRGAEEVLGWVQQL